MVQPSTPPSCKSFGWRAEDDEDCLLGSPSNRHNKANPTEYRSLVWKQSISAIHGERPKLPSWIWFRVFYSGRAEEKGGSRNQISARTLIQIQKAMAGRSAGMSGMLQEREGGGGGQGHPTNERKTSQQPSLTPLGHTPHPGNPL